MALTLRNVPPAAVQVHRINGALAQAGKRGRGKANVLRDRLLVLLAERPMHGGEIREALEVTYTRSNNLLADALRRNLIMIIGTAEQARKLNVRRDAKMYALPGTPPLPDLPKPVAGRAHRGEIAGACYHRGLHWGGWGSLG